MKMGTVAVLLGWTENFRSTPPVIQHFSKFIGVPPSLLYSTALRCGMEWLRGVATALECVMAYVYLVCSGLLVIAGTNAALMGIEWIYEFHGLHPLLAFPIALACMVGAMGCGVNAVHHMREE
jgi:hypothetical protein